MPAPRVIGVDLGGTKLLAGAVDPALGVHHRVQRTVAGLDQQALLDVALQAVTETIAAAGAPVQAVGFGIPVLIDRANGRAVVGVNTLLHDIPFAEVMTQRLGLPVFADNDGNCAALAEHRAGACRGYTEAIVVTLGTGIAGGLILRDELYRGARGAAGELGHMVIELDGPPCHGNCPNHGCAEVYVSGTALVEEAQRLGAIRPDSDLHRAVSENRAARRPADHRTGAGRRPVGDRGDHAGRVAARGGARQSDQYLQPAGDRDRRRRDHRRRAAAGAGACGRRRAGAAVPD